MDNKRPSLVPTFWATGVVLFSLGAYMAGFVLRTKSELGSSLRSNAGVLASTSKDPEVSESLYFLQVSTLLEQKFVEEITIDKDSAAGSVRGMIGELADPLSYYMEPKQFAAYQQRMSGKFEGIGIEVIRQFSPTELAKFQKDRATADSMLLLPEIVVSAVIPGSTGEAAGIKVGDTIRAVDNRWVVSYRDTQELRSLQEKAVDNPKFEAELRKLRDQLVDKLDTMLTPSKAKEQLMLGTKGSIEVAWSRGGQTFTKKIDKGMTELTPVDETSDNSYVLHFITGAEKEVSQIRSGSTIDLRNSSQGSFEVMDQCLSYFLPKGIIGRIVSASNSKGRPVTIADGSGQVSDLTLIVDQSTMGAAAVFATALSQNGVATLRGELPEDSNRWIQTKSLPNGAGYTLNIGKFIVGDAS